LHSPVKDRGNLQPELTHYVDADGGTNPHCKWISGDHNRKGFRRHGVSRKQSHVACPKSHYLQQTCGFFIINLIIKHTLPTAATRLHRLIYAIFLYIDTRITVPYIRLIRSTVDTPTNIIEIIIIYVTHVCSSNLFDIHGDSNGTIGSILRYQSLGSSPGFGLSPV
jgi:hypothetical protein